SNPMDLGFLDQGGYFVNVNATSFTVTIDDPATAPLPVTIRIEFDVSHQDGFTEVLLGTNVSVEEFWVELHLGLDYDADRLQVDLLHWMRDPANVAFDSNAVGPPGITVTYKGQIVFVARFVAQINVAGQNVDVGGWVQKVLRDKIFGKLTERDTITGRSKAD